MKKLVILAVVVLSVALIIGVNNAFAQKNQKPMLKCEDNFIAMDTDKDGKVTLTEFMAVEHMRNNPEEMFNLKDTNKDGYLTKEEFCAGHGKGMRQGMGNRKNK